MKGGCELWQSQWNLQSAASLRCHYRCHQLPQSRYGMEQGSSWIQWIWTIRFVQTIRQPLLGVRWMILIALIIAKLDRSQFSLRRVLKDIA